MEIKLKKEDVFTIIFVSGEIDAVTCERLQKKIDELIDNENKCLILDLADVNYISSAGLRVILATAKKLYSDGVFVITNPKPSVYEILDMVGLSNIIAIYDDLEAAKKSIKKQ